MTINEHLQFYAMMKGIAPDKIEDKVKEALKDVLL
jgi:ABC-type multidrug transport system ATPase subunit